MIKLVRANLYVGNVKVKGLILNIDHNIIPIVKDSSNIPLINRQSSISDLRNKYYNSYNQLLSLPSIPIVYDTGYELVNTQITTNGVRTIDMLDKTQGKFIVDTINLIVHDVVLPKVVTSTKLTLTDTAGKKYNTRVLKRECNNLVDASAGIMSEALPLPSSLLSEALEYCKILHSNGKIPEGYIYTDQGLEEYA